jgi:hypothetical protein
VSEKILITVSHYTDLVNKLVMYEKFLHAVQMHAEVTMNGAVVHQLIANACRWSYAHRQGNGELSEQEQHALVEQAFHNLLKVEKSG